MKLSGKVALVTGSGRGIGKAIALRLARDGADLVLHYNRSDAAAQEVLREISELGRSVHCVQGDLSDSSAVQRVVAEGVKHFGKLDVLVNNAGLERRAPFWEVTEEDYDRVLNVNLKAVFFASQAVVRHLRARRTGGRIINISSIHEDVAFPNFTPYAVSKGGVRLLTRTLAVELRGTDITVNAIAPGAIQTDINKQLLTAPAKRAALEAQIPLGRLGQPGDVAAVASFLASSDADYVTGATYYVDGGLAQHYQE